MEHLESRAMLAVSTSPGGSGLDSVAGLYWTAGGQIWRSQPDGSGREMIVSPPPGREITTFDIDEFNGRIYFADEQPNVASHSRISSTDLNGGDQRLVYQGTGLGHISWSMTVDPSGGYVFLHSHDVPPVQASGPFYEGKIQRVTIATGEVTVLPTTFWYVHDMQISESGKLYFTGFSDFVESAARFYVQGRDGTGNREIPIAGVASVNFALAEVAQSVYVSGGSESADKGDIYLAPIAGGSPTRLFDGTSPVYDIEFKESASLLYWLTAGGSIVRSNATGGDVQTVVSGISTVGRDLSVVMQPSILTISDVGGMKDEGDSGFVSFTFTVSRADSTAGVSTVAWAVTGSGANPASGDDFAGGVLPSGKVSFAAGESSKTITVAVRGDTVVEADEGFTVTLSSPSGAKLGTPAQASGTIRNDDEFPPPSLTIAAVKSTVKAGETVQLTFTFSEAPVGFSAEDVSAIHGTVSDVTGRGTVYTARFTPAADTEAFATVSVAADRFTGATAVGNLGSNEVSLTVDTAAPVVLSITSSRALLRPMQTSTITFVLSEPSTTFGLDDIDVAGGTLSNFTAVGSSQTTYTATFTPAAAFTGVGTISVAAGRFADAIGNLNTVAAALTPAIDIRTAIPVSLIEATRDGAVITSLAAGQAADIAFYFVTPVQGFAAGDIVVTGGTLTDFAGSGQFYSARFTPRANSIAAGMVSIPAGRFTDAAGNPNSLLQLSSSIPINTVVPSMTISQRLRLLKAGQSTTVTFQVRGRVSEANPFTLADIALAPGQGTLSPLTDRGVVRGIHTYTAIYTAPADSFAGHVLLTVPADSFRIVGNAFNGNAATSLKINVDAQGPRPVISTTATATGLKSGQTAVVDFTIANETANVVGFDAADVSLSSGSIGKPTRVPGTTIYRATYTPAPDFEGTVTIALPAGTFTDAVGNPNTAASTITIDVDTLAPTAPPVSLVSDTGSSSTDKITSDARLQTPVTEPSATVQFWSSVGLTTPWTGPRTGVNTLWATQTDAAGNRSSATRFDFQYYATGPIVSAFVPAPASTGLRAGAFVQLSVRFDRPVFVTGNTTDRPFITIGGFTTGASTRNAVYSSGNGTSTLVFRYRVVAGDKAPTGITFPSTAITLEGAALADAAGNAAALGFTLPSRRPLTRVNA
jgi:hypothetical protein